MRTQALSTSLPFKRITLALVAASGLVASSAVLAEDFSGYVGATYGVAPSQRKCDQAPVCNRVATAGKLFGGWNMTPNVAAEINYFYFTSLDKTYDGTQSVPADVSSIKESSRAVTLGINWGIELFQVFTNNIRLGVAQTQLNKTTTSITTGPVISTTFERTYRVVPYLGLGITLPINSTVSIQSGYDYMIDGDASLHLFSVGMVAQF